MIESNLAIWVKRNIFQEPLNFFSSKRCTLKYPVRYSKGGCGGQMETIFWILDK